MNSRNSKPALICLAVFILCLIGYAWHVDNAALASGSQPTLAGLVRLLSGIVLGLAAAFIPTASVMARPTDRLRHKRQLMFFTEALIMGASLGRTLCQPEVNLFLLLITLIAIPFVYLMVDWAAMGTK